MEAPEVLPENEPQHERPRGRSSSSEQSAAEDVEWKPCQRKVVRPVNLQRSQATKLMWQRRKAAALLQQQQQLPQNPGGGAGPSPPPGSRTKDYTAAALHHPTTTVTTPVGTDCSNLTSESRALAAQPQHPQLSTRRRRLQNKATGVERPCLSNATPRPSLAEKILDTEDDYPESKQFSSLEFQDSCHVTWPSSLEYPSNSAIRTKEVPLSHPLTGVGRQELERTYRPKMLPKLKLPTFEQSDDEFVGASSTSNEAERPDEKPSMEFLVERLRLQPELLATTHSKFYDAMQRHSAPQYGMCKQEAELRGREVTRPERLLFWRGNYYTESEALAQGLPVPSYLRSSSETLSSQQQASQHSMQENSLNSVKHASQSGSAPHCASANAAPPAFKLPPKLRLKPYRDRLLACAVPGTNEAKLPACSQPSILKWKLGIKRMLAAKGGRNNFSSTAKLRTSASTEPSDRKPPTVGTAWKRTWSSQTQASLGSAHGSSLSSLQRASQSDGAPNHASSSSVSPASRLPPKLRLKPYKDELVASQAREQTE